MGSIPSGGAKIPPASCPKIQNIDNRRNIVTNSTKTFKMAHIKKVFTKKIKNNKNNGEKETKSKQLLKTVHMLTFLLKKKIPFQIKIWNNFDLY